MLIKLTLTYVFVNWNVHFHCHVSRFAYVKFQTNLTCFRWIIALCLGVHFFRDTVYILTTGYRHCRKEGLPGRTSFCLNQPADVPPDSWWGSSGGKAWRVRSTARVDVRADVNRWITTSLASDDSLMYWPNNVSRASRSSIRTLQQLTPSGIELRVYYTHPSALSASVNLAVYRISAASAV